MWLRHNEFIPFISFYTVAPYMLGFSMGFSVLKLAPCWDCLRSLWRVTAPGVGAVARVYHQQSDSIYFWNLN